MRINPQKDKRKNTRMHTDAMMKYIQKDTDQYFSGDVCNLSQCGLCFKTGYFIQPGAIIKIKIEENMDSFPLSEKIHDCHAKVKWCSNSPGHAAFFYQVGVEFFEL